MNSAPPPNWWLCQYARRNVDEVALQTLNDEIPWTHHAFSQLSDSVFGRIEG